MIVPTVAMMVMVGASAPGTGPIEPGAGTGPGPVGAPPDAAEPAANEVAPPSDPRATPVAVTTRLEPDPSNIGDVLTLEVVAAYPRDVSVNLPTGLELSGLHVRGIEPSDPESTGSGLRKTFRIELQYFEVGEGSVPAFPLTWVDADGGVHTLEVPGRTFTVEALLANEADAEPRPDDPPRSIAYPNALAETIVYSVLGTLVLALVGWWLGRRWWAKRARTPAPPPVPAHEVALGALDRLEGEDLVNQGRFTEHYLELTEITKAYLEGRFGLDALDRTTEEIRRELIANGARIEPLGADDVIRFLQRADLVKFARFPPEPEEARGATAEVRTMVERTRPQGVDPERPRSEPGDGENEDEGAGSNPTAEGTPPSEEAGTSGEARP